MDSTIAAISTPRAMGGISVIRISGDMAIEIASKVFRGKNVDDIGKMQGYTCCYGDIVDGNTLIDDGILTVFKAPHSYTGEDVCEISCHGGIFITQKILNLIYKNGAIPADRGEFTKRGFLNGKMSLTQAESVMDIISANGELAHKSAVSARNGRLFKNIKNQSDKLIQILGNIAAWVDYPEEDIDDVLGENIKSELINIQSNLQSILDNYNQGRIIREGIDSCIVGKPNVGKSTIMNLMSGCERSIVTNIAGTTRDIIEESVRIGDVVLRLSDTAGIRFTDDIVEAMGVNRAVEKINSADLIIAVFDGSAPLEDEDYELLSKIEGLKKVLVVLNKDDMGLKLNENDFSEMGFHCVSISANDNSSINVLENAIKNIFKLDEFDFDNSFIVNDRQKNNVIVSLSAIDEAISGLDNGVSLDAISVVLDDSLNSLLELNGEKATEEVVNEVFSHFCVGK